MTGFGHVVEVDGHPVVLGDHTYVVKDGGRMPGVVALRETSETQSKPAYFRGQCWGAVGVLVGTCSACFCSPLRLQIHQGFQHLGETVVATVETAFVVCLGDNLTRPYCVEILFAMLKQVIGAFRFHFWSQYLPLHSRKPVSNQQLKSPRPQHIDKVKACWQAMEMFVFCASVSTGLLQQFSLRYADGLWQQQVLYLRTRSRELPSENTVRQILAPLIARELMQSRPEFIWAKICKAISDQPDDKRAIED